MGAQDAHRERRLVTCLFVDIVGSSDSTLHLGPERMQRLLSEAFAEISATIAEHGGTVEKYVGDAVFALFGVPTAHTDDAARALQAAKVCLSKTDVAVRIGIESGEVLVDLNAIEHRQRIAVGTAVNLAARLQQVGDPGQILVGPTCHTATAAVAHFETLGTLSLKGIGEVQAWRFIDFAVEGVKPVSFVGREQELRELDGAFERARRGIATLAVIMGPPGQGKSRLAQQAIKRWAPDRLVEARCRPGAETGTNTPLMQLLSADVREPTPDRVADRVSALVRADEGAALATAICHAAGLAADERLLALTRIEQREIIAEAWRRYLAAICRGGQTLVVWIEDLHWADPVLLRIVDRASTDLEAPLLVLCTARPELAGSASIRPRKSRLHIELEPLDPQASAELARLAGDGVDGAERAGGNPLFIIELARARSRGEEVPLTVQAAIEARLDELEASDRALLQHASVAGETFDIHDATLLAQAEPASAAAALGRIAHLGFIVPVDSAFRFHHALVRDIAYGRLPIAERMSLHARYAQEGVDSRDALALAHHWWLALDPAEAEWVWDVAEKLRPMRRQAFDAHLAAGRRLEERNAYEDALTTYERAVELADDAPSRAQAHVAVGRAYARNGRGDEAWEHRLRAIEFFREAGMPPPARLYADMLEIATQNWGYFNQVPDDAEVLRLLAVGEAVARAEQDSVSLARLLVGHATFTGDLAVADEVTRLLESPAAVQFAEAAGRIAQEYLLNGQVTRALQLFDRVFEEFVPSGGIVNEPEALVWYSLSILHAGDLARADSIADRLMLESLRRSPHVRQHAYGLKGFLHVAAGRWDEAAALRDDLQELIEASPGLGFCLIGAAGIAYGATADLLAGRRIREDMDQIVERIAPQSPLIRTSALMLPKLMSGDVAALKAGLRAYEHGLRLLDRQRFWDAADLMPAIALTILERWDELGPHLERLELFARGGSSLARAVIAAVREEESAARGGSAPRHAELNELRCSGISRLLRFRPSVIVGVSQ